MKPDIIEELKEYLSSTPKEKVKEDWEKICKETEELGPIYPDDFSMSDEDILSILKLPSSWSEKEKEAAVFGFRKAIEFYA